MLNTTPSANQARKKLDQWFEVLQAVQLKMKPLRDAGKPVPLELYKEWDAAYAEFQKAHEEWKRVTPLVHQDQQRSHSSILPGRDTQSFRG